MNICPICRKEARYIYCSLSCSNRSKFAKNEAKYFKNPKLCKECAGPVPYEGRHYSVFCSRSCSAKFNNKKREKKIRKCSLCRSLLHLKGHSRICSGCIKTSALISFGQRSVSEFNSTYARHKYQRIRHHAHRVAEHLGLIKKCVVCGYDKHAELAHKKSISSFVKDAKLSEVNSEDNLIYLCPNHHWEFDSGILDL